MRYTASRISEGNNLFPCQIITEDYGITCRIPGFFNNEDEFIDYENITKVDVNTPLIGYSTIKIYSKGNSAIIAHGFTKDQVWRIKNAIKNKGE